MTDRRIGQERRGEESRAGQILGQDNWPSTYCDEHNVNRLNEKQMPQSDNFGKTRSRRRNERQPKTINRINHIKLTYQAKIDRKQCGCVCVCVFVSACGIFYPTIIFLYQFPQQAQAQAQSLVLGKARGARKSRKKTKNTN